MAKTWDEMTTAEKVDDLRDDIKTIMATVNAWTDSQQKLGASLNRVSNLLSEVEAAVRQLEHKAGN